MAANKSGSYDSTANKVKYTVSVESTGENSKVVVTDEITGTALTLDTDSFVIRGTDGTVRTDIEPVISGNRFTLTISEMANKERLTVEYTASVNWDEIGNGKGTVEQTGNSVTVKSDEDPHNDPITHNLENQISYNPLTKSAGAVSGEETADTKIVPWTITLNAQQLKNMAGTTITDTIDYGSQSIMRYTGTGVTMTVKDQDSAVGEPQVLTWAELGIDPTTDKSWSFTIPDNGQPNHYQYIFTYDTLVDVSAQNGNTYVSNRVSDQDWNGAGGWQEVHPGSGVIGVAKANNSATETEMTWTVTLDVPAGGLNKAVVTDNFPTLNWGGEQFQDTLKANTIEIDGLDSNENYTIRTTDDKYVITFFKDQLKTEPGLNASGTDERRTITITFTTENDQAWIALHREQDHTNYVTFEGDNGTVTDQATGNVPQTGVKKTGRVLDTVEYNGENVVIFEYTIDLYGVQGTDFPIAVTDTYDSALTFFDLIGGNGSNGLPGMATYWGQQVQNGYRNGTHRDEKLHPVNDTNTHTLTFTINETDVDKDGDGNFLPRYQIIYYMIASEEALITSSISKADRTEEIGNTAAWGNSDDTVTIDYSYPALVKNNVPPSSQSGLEAGQQVLYDPEKGTTGFEIVINPGGRTLNGGSPMTMTDEFSATLSVDYSSIRVWVDGAEDTGTPRQVTYDYRGNKGTFTVPDGKYVVIRYDAKVIGNPGQWVSYNNTATMNGYSDGSAGNTQIAGSGEAGFNINSIKVYKYAAGDMTQAIGGVTFTLVDASGDPVLYTVSSSAAGHEHTAGQPVTFTTNASGYAEIKPSEQDDGFSLQKGVTYYLKETGTPSAYARNNTIYRFTLSDHPDYAVYEYHSGDIMKIYNWPALGRIDVRKTFVGASANLTDADKRRITFEITGTYDGTNPVKMDAYGYPITQEEAQTGEYRDFKRTFTYADFSLWGGEYIYSMEDLVDGIYTVRETNAALPGYNTVVTTYTVDSDPAVQGTDATVTISNKNSHQVDFTNTYENKKPGVDIVIKKINRNGETVTNLYGAKFKLEKWNASANAGAGAFEAYTEGSVDTDGTFTITYSNKDTGVTLSSLDVGRYRITEIQAPNNYKIAENGDGKFEFEVTGSGNSLSVSYTSDTDVDSFADGNTFSVNNQVKYSYNITKVDGANVSLKLAGAEFGVYQHVLNNTPDQDREAAKSGALTRLYTYVSDLDGRFEIQFNDLLDGGAHYSDAQDVTYFIMETKAPKGYSLPYNPVLYYFFFGAQNPSDLNETKALNLAEYTWNRTITNDLIELQVTKTWRDLDNGYMLPDDVDEVEFRLYQTEYVTNRETLETVARQKTQYPDNNTVYTISKNAYGNWPTLTIGYLPVVGARNENEVHTYSYSVEEIVPNGYQVSYAEDENGRHLTMTNRPEGTYLEVLKVWSGNTPSNLKKTAFYLQRKLKDGSGAWTDYRTPPKTLPNAKPEGSTLTDEEWLASEAAWLLRWDDLPKEYVYRVRESLTDGGMTTDQAIRFEIVESANNAAGVSEGRVAVTNNYQSTSIEVEKKWVNETPTVDSFVYFTLYCRPAGSGEDFVEAATVMNVTQGVLPHVVWTQATGNQYQYSGDEAYKNWIYAWDDLPDDYEYKVIESPKAGYTTVYSANNENGITSGRITVTNIKTNIDDGKVGVQKVWLDAQGNALPAGEIPDNVQINGNLKRTVMGMNTDNGCKVTIIRQAYNGEETLYPIETIEKYVERDSTLTLSANWWSGYTVSYDNSNVTRSKGESWEHTWTVTGDLEITFSSDDKEAWGAPNITFDAIEELPYDQQISVANPTTPFQLPNGNAWYMAVQYQDEPNQKSFWTVTDVSETVNGDPLSGFVLSYENNNGVQTGTILMMNTQVEPTETSAAVTKVWNNADGSAAWPTGVTVEATLYQTVNGATTAVDPADLAFWGSTLIANPVTLASGAASAAWDKLPLKDGSDNDVTYSVAETAVKYNGTPAAVTTAGGMTTYTVGGRTYDSARSVSGANTTITNTERITVNAEKTWETGIDASQYTVRVRLNQYVDGTINNDFAPADQIKTLTATGWTASWGDLPVIDAAGHALTYGVTEIGVFHGGTDVTAQFIAVAVATGIKNYAATVDVPVTKVWDLGGAELPTGATVTAVICQRERLIVDNGAEVASPADWSGSYTATAHTVTITGTGTTWNGSAAGLPKYRYDSAENDLYEIQYTAREIRVTAADGITDLTENYSAAATVNPDGSVTITNTPKNGISLNVEKIWDDSYNASGIRPASITVQLYSSEDGFAAPMAGKDIVLSAANDWRGGWTNLDDQYTYKVQEKTVGGYTVSYNPTNGVYAVTDGKNTDGNTVTITNSRSTTPPTGTLELYKVWQDTAGHPVTDNLPEQVQFELVKASQSSGTSTCQVQLLICDNWNAFAYYTKNGTWDSAHLVNKGTITVSQNSNVVVRISGTKHIKLYKKDDTYWGHTELYSQQTTNGSFALDNEEQYYIIVWQDDGTWPNLVDVLEFSGESANSDTHTYPMTLTLNEANGWYDKVTGLDPDHNTYTLKEIVPEGAAYVPFSYTVNGTEQMPDAEGKVSVEPGTVVVTNRIPGEIKLKKLVTVEGSPAGNDVTGTYTFHIAGNANDPNTGSVSKTLKISLNNGEYTATLNGAPVSADGEGWFTITGLPHGAYTVTEAGTNWAGYNCATSFSVNGFLTVGSSAAVTLNGTTPTATVQATNAYTPGVELPATGGPGTAAYTASGLALILGALWMLLRRRRETN